MAVHGRQHIRWVTDELIVTEVGKHAEDSMAPMDRMDRTWRDQNQANGNLDTDVLTKLGTIVEATRVAVDHVLRISGDAIQ